MTSSERAFRRTFSFELPLMRIRRRAIQSRQSGEAAATREPRRGGGEVWGDIEGGECLPRTEVTEGVGEGSQGPGTTRGNDAFHITKSRTVGSRAAGTAVEED